MNEPPRRLTRVLAASFLAAGLLVTTAGAAVAVSDPEAPAAPVCSATPNPAGTNSTITITGTGFQPGSSETITGSGSGKVTNSTTTSDSTGATTVTEQVTSAGSAVFTVTGTLPGGTSGSCTATTVVNATAPKTMATQVGRVSTGTPHAGSPTTFSGCGYRPGSTVTVTDTAGNEYGTAPVGSDGCFSKTITFSDPGEYTLMATGIGANGGVLVTTAHVHVLGLSLTNSAGTSVSGSSAPGTGASGGLAFTGADGVATMTLIGVGLVAAGSGFVARGRRRRQVEAT